MIGSALFIALILTPWSVSSQNRPLAIEYNGIRGVFLPEELARERAIQIEKGFTYYKNWQISEVQISELKITIQNLEAEIQMRILDLEEEKTLTRISRQALNQALEDRDLAVSKYENEKKKNKLIPWIAGGSFLLGGWITYQFTR